VRYLRTRPEAGLGDGQSQSPGRREPRGACQQQAWRVAGGRRTGRQVLSPASPPRANVDLSQVHHQVDRPAAGTPLPFITWHRDRQLGRVRCATCPIVPIRDQLGEGNEIAPIARSRACSRKPWPSRFCHIRCAPSHTTVPLLGHVVVSCIKRQVPAGGRVSAGGKGTSRSRISSGLWPVCVRSTAFSSLDTVFRLQHVLQESLVRETSPLGPSQPFRRETCAGLLKRPLGSARHDEYILRIRKPS